MNRWHFSIALLLINPFSQLCAGGITPDSTGLWSAARQQFYQAVNEKQFLTPAVLKFEALCDQYPAYQARFRTYLGALEALKGKHAFWPHQKYQHVIRGLARMDSAIAQNPDDLEALFIHSITGYYLPGFFNRELLAQDYFKKIVVILPNNFQAYDAELVRHVIEFLKQHAPLTPAENARLENLRLKMGPP